MSGGLIIPDKQTHVPEGWDKTEYINKLKELLDSTGFNRIGEMMDDFISRQAAIDIVEFECGEWRGLARTIVEAIEQLPSAQPETAKRIVGKSRDGMTLWYQCDMCNEPVDARDGFCRGCGRRLIDG